MIFLPCMLLRMLLLDVILLSADLCINQDNKLNYCKGRRCSLSSIGRHTCDDLIIFHVCYLVFCMWCSNSMFMCVSFRLLQTFFEFSQFEQLRGYISVIKGKGEKLYYVQSTTKMHATCNLIQETK
jgi:hypothetical protein